MMGKLLQITKISNSITRGIKLFYIPLLLISFTQNLHANSNITNFVTSVSEQAIGALTGNISDQTRERNFQALLLAYFDVYGISKFTMGKIWRQASKDQRASYQKKLVNVLTRQYTAMFKKYSNQTVEVVGRVNEVRPGRYIVRTHIIDPGNKTYVVDWRIRKIGNQYKVFDLVVEGVSMGVSQREEIQSLLSRNQNDIDQLIDALN